MDSKGVLGGRAGEVGTRSQRGLGLESMGTRFLGEREREREQCVVVGINRSVNRQPTLALHDGVGLTEREGAAGGGHSPERSRVDDWGAHLGWQSAIWWWRALVHAPILAPPCTQQ